MLRFYYILLGALAAIWLVLSIPEFGLILVYITIGIAAPLFLAPTLLIYLLCALPALHLWWFRSTRAAGVLVSLAAAGTLAVTPGLISREQVADKLAELEAKNIRPPGDVAYRSIEYDRVQGMKTPCDGLCQYLMRTGQLDWIRFGSYPAQETSIRHGAPTTMVIAAGFGAECAIDDLLAEPADFCLLAAADGGDPADLVYQAENYRVENADHFLDQPGERAGRRIEFLSGNATARTPVYRNFAEAAEPYRIPAVLEPELATSGSSGRFLLSRKSRWLNEANYEAALAAVGFTLPDGDLPREDRPWKKEPTAAQTRTVLSMLDLPFAEPFNSFQQDMINEWARRAPNYETWSAFRLDLAGRILFDARANSVEAMSGVLAQSPVAARYLGRVLAPLAEKGPSGLKGGAYRAARGVNRIDPEILVLHEPVLRRISERDDLRGFKEPVARALAAIEQYRKNAGSPGGG